MVDEETFELPLVMGRHQEKLQFDITDAPGCDVVLGLPWLKESSPTINWRRNTIAFGGSESMPLFVVRDELDTIDIHAMSATELMEAIEQDPKQVQVLYCKKTEGKPVLDIPPEYSDFKHLFEKEADEDALPEHQPWDHEIRIQEGKEPKKEPLRPMSAEKAEYVRKYVDEGLRKGHIRESESPAGYPLHIVPKGDEYRVCVDYRGLNAITVKNSYPLPLIHELQDRLQGAQWFTAFDIPGAYNRIRIKAGHEWKTAFRTRFGLYEYLVMPFGLTNAPATFQAYINNVLQALADAKMKIKPEKTEFHKTEVKFLGYIVGREGLKMDQKKIEAVTSWPKPNSVREVQSFLGFANFYRQFIKDYSKIAAPLTELTKKDKEFEWTAEAEGAFDELKTRFSTEPILVIFDPKKPSVVETDASDRAIGACLSQADDKGKLRPVAYLSRKFTPAESNYEVHDKELLAIIEAFRHWRVYLEGQAHETKCISDHQNLSRFLTTHIMTPRQMRWYQDIATFRMKIHYRKGSENARADAMSRREDYMKGEPKKGIQLLVQNADGTLQVNKIAATSVIEATRLSDEIRDELPNDSFARTVRENPAEHPNFEDRRGWLLFEGLVYVPTRLREKVLQCFHDGPVRGHPGTTKMLQLVQDRFYFPRMRHAVEEYVRKCAICRRNKHDRHAPYGLLQPLQVPTRPWQSVAMDFIVKLPPSADPVTGEIYDGIMVTVDRFSKYGRFIPYRETWTATDLAHEFLKNVVANHGLPESLISDRDKLFTSNFWTALMQHLSIKHKMSTAYHPQTDGQTERLNQILEQYLRLYVNARQDNWVQLLPLAQIAYNHAPTSTTGTSPFYANFGFEPKDFSGTAEVLADNPTAALTATELREMQANLRLDLMFCRQQMTKYANRTS
ncbi:reverse transcriptase domain protein [Venturia nashicola]|nr:reverse transcriptase domain protein [Venturia nashicola]